VITASPSAADTLAWSVNDSLGNAVPAAVSRAGRLQHTTLSFHVDAGRVLRDLGERLPKLAVCANGWYAPDRDSYLWVLPNVTGTCQRRLRASGATSIWHAGLQRLDQDAQCAGYYVDIDDRQLSTTEPNGPNSWTPTATTTDTGYASGQIMRLVRLDGISAWDSPTGASTSSYLPIATQRSRGSRGIHEPVVPTDPEFADGK